MNCLIKDQRLFQSAAMLTSFYCLIVNLIIRPSEKFPIRNGSRKIANEENRPSTLILTLILNQTLTLTGGNFPGGNFPDTIRNI